MHRKWERRNHRAPHPTSPHPLRDKTEKAIHRKHQGPEKARDSTAVTTACFVQNKNLRKNERSSEIPSLKFQVAAVMVEKDNDRGEDMRVDLNEGCAFRFISVFSRNFGICRFFPIGKYRNFGKILKKTEEHSSLRSTLRTPTRGVSLVFLSFLCVAAADLTGSPCCVVLS